MGGGATGRRGVRLRQGLVVLQFALSMILLVGVGVMYRQIEYMKGRDLHFDRDGVVVLPVAPRDFADREGAVERIATLRDRLAQRSVVASVSASGAVPSRFGGSFTLVRPEGEEDRTPLDWRFVVVDDRFFDTYGIDFVEGRGFSRDFATDAETGVVLNRAALRVLVVVHALRDKDVIRIISARKATRQERQQYQGRLR